MLFVLISFILQCKYYLCCNVAWVVSIFGVPSTVLLGLSVLDIQFFLGDTLGQVISAYRDDTTISFGYLLYGILWESYILHSLTVFMSLSTWPSFSSSPPILTCTDLNYLRTTSKLLSPTIVSLLILRAVNTYFVVFRQFYDSML